MMLFESPLAYVSIINPNNQPLLFRQYSEAGFRDQLNFQLHVYSALDLFEQKMNARRNEYLGYITTVLSSDGQFDIYAYYSVTKVKVMLVLKQKPSPNDRYDDVLVSQFLKQIYYLYRGDLFNPFNTSIASNRLSDIFLNKLDVLVKSSKLK